MSEPAVAVIVLAAGQSSRLGRPKQLLPVSGRPLLERTLDLVRRAPFAPRLLVLGAHADDIEPAVNTRGFHIVHNPAYADGQATSLAAGLRALPDDIAGALVLLADQPLVPAWLPEELRAAFDPARHDAIRPRYADGPGNPVLLGRALFPKLERLSGDVGARAVLRAHAARIAELAVPTQAAPRDVDTPDDYAALLLDWSSTGAPYVPRHCQRCGAAVELREVRGRLRAWCPACEFTHYADPKLAVAVVVEVDGRIVLQRRAIEPSLGAWTFPGGFVDRGEDVAQAAAREVREEVGLAVDNVRLLGIYCEPGETVTLVGYYASANGQAPVVGDESSAVALYEPGDLPPLAFTRDARILSDWTRRMQGA